MGKCGWKIIHGLVEGRSKSEMSELRWKSIYRLIEAVAIKREIEQCDWKAVDWFVEGPLKREVGECGWKCRNCAIEPTVCKSEMG